MNNSKNQNDDLIKIAENDNGEFSVNEAAEYLKVNPRSIINYIRAKQLKATKVGKVWFINKQSLKKFGEKFGFNRGPELDDDPLKNSQPLFNIIQQQSQQTQVHTNGVQNTNNSSNAVTNKFSVLKLRLFQLAVGVFSLPQWKELEKKVNRDDIENLLLRLKNDSLQLIGSGFYSFSPNKKCALYSASRERIGAILAIWFQREKIYLKVLYLASVKFYTLCM